MRMSWLGVERLGDAAGDGIQLDADEARARLALAHEIAGAAAGLQDGGVAGNAQAGDGLVDGRDDGRRRIEGVEGGALGAVVFLGSEQRLQLLAEGLPAGILVPAGDRIGKIDRATGPKPAKRASVCFSSGVAGRCSCSMALSVRMAARMSRALAFSPLAMRKPV